MRRRKFLNYFATAILASAFTGVRQAVAQVAERIWPARPREAFSADTLAQTIDALFGEREILDSEKITITAAELAENGAVVPVKINTEFPHAKQITILASKNPVPLVGSFSFGARVQPFIATRIKLAESSEIIAIVETDDGLYQARRFVEVTIGGCGA